ncbi:hypothetical protein D9M71_488610 [compost metagenome]
MQDVVVAVRHGQFALRRLPGLQDLVGEGGEGFTVGGQPGAGAVAYEERRIEVALQLLDPCGDGGLSEVQVLGGRDETAVPNDFEESASQIDIHGAYGQEGGTPVQCRASSLSPW